MAIVLVTGASGGIGSAICRVLARRGATLALHYQADPDGAEQARRSLEGTGHVLVRADLAAPASIERLWREVARLGPVDALINNAGIFPDHPPLASSYEEWTRAWERTLAVNLVVELSARHRILIVGADPRQSAKELVARSRRRSTPRRRILLGSSTGVCRLLANLDPVD